MHISLVIVFSTVFLTMIGLLGLSTETALAQSPTATLERKVNGSWGAGDVTIAAGTRVDLRWSGANATSCSGSGSGFGTGGNTSGHDWFIDEPTAGNSRTFTVTCTGGGGTASDSITVTAAALPVPTATLERKVNGSWGAGDVTIAAGTRVDLRWSGANATSCSGSGSGFGTGGNTSGHDWFIDEPTAGNSRTFTVTCTGGGGTASDSITVTAAADPTATLQVKFLGSWHTDDYVGIIETDNIALRWSSTNADSCSGSGSGFSTGGNINGTDWQITEPTLGNSITYTVTCSGGGVSASDSITVTTNLGYQPTATLERKVNSGPWSTSNVNINVGDQVSLRWSSTDATSCLGGGFGGGGYIGASGTDNTITEPTAGNSITYTLYCYGVGGSRSDTLTVTTNN